MLQRPAEVLATLNRTPQLWSGAPNVRAGLFARADVRDRAQREQLEVYWQRRDVPALERRTFAEQFPFYDLAVSGNLLTQTPTRPLSDLLAQDRATLQMIGAWRADPRLVAWSDAFALIERRLREPLGGSGALR